MEPLRENNDDDPGGPSADSGPPRQPVASWRRRDKMPYGHQPPPPSSAYFPVPAWLPTPPPTTTMHSSGYSFSPYGYGLPQPPPPLPMAPVPTEARLMQAPTMPGRKCLLSPPEAAKNVDLEKDRLKKELHSLRAEISKQNEARRQDDLMRKTREDREREMRERMEALREAQEEAKREIVQARVAAEAAARERLREQKKAEEERHRAEEDIKAQAIRQERERFEAEEKAKEERAQRRAATLAEAERSVLAKLQKEMNAEAERKLRLEREIALFEQETRTRLRAESKAREEVLAVESRKRQAEELEAREKKVFEAEIVNKYTTALMAREKAVFEAEIRSQYARDARLDARERALFEAETRQHLAAELLVDKTEDFSGTSTATDDSETEIYLDQDDNEDDTSYRSIIYSEHETNNSDSPEDSIRGSISVQPTGRGQLESPDGKTPKQEASGALFPVDIDAIYNSTSTRDLTVHLDLELSQDIDNELEEFSRLSRIGNFASAESFFDLHLRSHLSNPYLFVQYADMLLEKGDYKALVSIDDSSVFVGRGEDGPHDYEFEFHQLEMNWKLIRAIALCHSQHELHAVREVIEYPCWSVRDMLHVGSTEASNHFSEANPSELYINIEVPLYAG